MATRAHGRGRRTSQSLARLLTGERQSEGMLLIGSFIIGAVLELLRSVPAIAANWRWDTALVLAAAWVVAVLAVRWPGTNERALPRLMALLLLVLFVGTLAMHYLLNQH